MGGNKRNYSKIDPTSVSSTSSTTDSPLTTPTATPIRSKRPLLVVGAIGLALLILVGIIVASCSGGGSGEDDSTTTRGIGSAHGPTSIVNGIPTGYTRDKPGAATAAVNFITAVDEATAGRVSGAKLKDMRVAADASPELLKVIQSASDRREVAGWAASSSPAMTTLQSFSNDKAVVSIWSVTAGQTKLNDEGKVGIMTVWSTTTVTLSWSGEDWKASDWQFANGPDPKNATFPAGDSAMAAKMQTGHYSFFVD